MRLERDSECLCIILWLGNNSIYRIHCNIILHCNNHIAWLGSANIIALAKLSHLYRQRVRYCNHNIIVCLSVYEQNISITINIATSNVQSAEFRNTRIGTSNGNFYNSWLPFPDLQQVNTCKYNSSCFKTIVDKEQLVIKYCLLQHRTLALKAFCHFSHFPAPFKSFYRHAHDSNILSTETSATDSR